MFENVLGQEASSRLSVDLQSATLPPAILFAGPVASGKGTSALELARVLSCEGDASWNCPCSACALHRLLAHPDLLIFGPRSFASELGAAASAFQRDPASSARFLFLRSARKLLARFSPILWEGDESKLGKVGALVTSLGEYLEEISALEAEALEGDSQSARKLVDTTLQTAIRLESEGVSEFVPIGQVRRASYWARLAPSGRRKVIVIENADRMQEGSRNALLKILEEPPDTAAIVLTTARRGVIMPTILSRVRPYVFYPRDADTEREVIRRVFRDAPAAAETSGPNLVSSYLESFLPVPPFALDAAASFFAASAAAAAVPVIRSRTDGSVPHALIALGRAATSRAEAAGMGRPVQDARAATAMVLEKSGKFEPRSLFSSFLDKLLQVVAIPLRDPSTGHFAVQFAANWANAARRADIAVGTYNQTPALALERLFVELVEAISLDRGSYRL